MGFVMRFSISAGAAPSYSVRIVSAGCERSGSRLMFSRESATEPKRITATVHMAMVTRRRVARWTRFMETVGVW